MSLDVINDTGSGIQSRTGHPGLASVDGNHRVGLGRQRPHHWNDSSQLFGLVDRSRPRPGGLPPDVDKLGPFGDQLLSPRHGPVGI